ncbi:MAG: 1,4-beta-xylanase [Porticoccaceae bacterium]|nr:1,4-beta-xylanase [Porticoccaceae bacterium]|tara:strand:- start:147 stop:1304 length:1158 start_codon:yes stop_codon:yes gene_type:complete
MINRRNLIKNTTITAGALLSGCYRLTNQETTLASLSEAFKGQFRFGTSIKNDTLQTNDTGLLTLVAKEFNAITADNAMKWEGLQPKLEEFNWQKADKFVNYGKQNNMQITGHVLVWHKQTPNYVFMKDSEIISKKLLLKRMETHISKVMERYKEVTEWDVVNEAIDGEKWLDSKWYKIIGPDYVKRAFQFARNANPSATLIYNDYGVTNPRKQQAIIDLLNKLKTSGVKIDGVGMQSHFSLEKNFPSVDMIEKTIERFARQGYQVFITELDVDVLPRAWKYVRQPPLQQLHISEIPPEDAKYLDPYTRGLPAQVSKELADRYASVFNVFSRQSDNISRVTVWGTLDTESWKHDWPILGRTNYPLLFDNRGNPKKAYFSVLGEGNS